MVKVLSEKELIAEETIYMKVKPHPLAYIHFYIFFIYYIIASALVLHYREAITQTVLNTFLGVFGETAVDVVFILLMWLILVVPALIFSVLRIAWKWLILYVLLASGLTYFYIKYSVAPINLFLIVLITGVIGVILTDFFRRSHEYIITNYRIITHEGWLTKKARDVFYENISDVIVIQPFIGKIFNFGTIIPVTPSGIGTGEDIAQVTVGVGAEAGAPQKLAKVGTGVVVTGGKTVVVPRGREAFILHGIPDPWELRKFIIDLKKKEDPVTHLKQVVSLLKQIVK